MNLYYFQAEQIAETAIMLKQHAGRRYRPGAVASIARAMMLAKRNGHRAVIDAAEREMTRFQQPMINPRWDGSVG